MAEVDGEQVGTPVGERACRVHWFAGRVHEVLDEVTVGGAPVSQLSAAETAEAVKELTRAQSRLEALKCRLLTHGDRVDVAAEAGATSTGAWLAAETRTVRGKAQRLVRLAKQLDTVGEESLEATAEAFLAGAIDLDQAQVITDAVTALPASLSPRDRHRAEEHLVGEAAHHDAKALKLLARHLLHVIDPDAADAELAAQLEREEAQASRRTMLKLFDAGDGTCHGTFRIPTLQAAMLSTALDALASPRRPDPIDRETFDDAGRLVQRTAPEVLGQAFVELLERYPVTKLPKTGGGLATVLVTIPLALLEDGLGVATLSTGGHLSVGAARRLACHAGLIPMVLGSKSEVLDQGRKVRLHTPAQRTAMTARDQRCTAEGCTIPAAWCHAHHKIPWARGGRTSVADGRMVCPRHHRMIHHPRYTTDYLPNGRIRITKRRRQ